MTDPGSRIQDPDSYPYQNEMDPYHLKKTEHRNVIQNIYQLKLLSQQILCTPEV